MTKFEEYLKDAFSESINDVFRHNRKTNEAYKKLLDDYNQQFECIRKRLGEDESLIMELEEIGNHRGVMSFCHKTVISAVTKTKGLPEDSQTRAFCFNLCRISGFKPFKV